MKFRAIHTATWDFESASLGDAQKMAESRFAKFAQAGMQFDLKVSKNKPKTEKTRLGEFPPAEVLAHITRSDEKKEFACGNRKYLVKMNSPRYFLFRDFRSCIACGLEGTKMYLEYYTSDAEGAPHPHFNLYGEENGELLPMTKDHIQAKSCNGKDTPSNYNLMCLTCNNLKGHSNLTVDSVRQMRKLYNEMRLLPSKEMHAALEELRNKLQKPWPDYRKKIVETLKKASRDCVITTSDLNIVEADGHLVAQHIYDDVAGNHFGCIRKWTPLEPLATSPNFSVCMISEKHAVQIPEGLYCGKLDFI